MARAVGIERIGEDTFAKAVARLRQPPFVLVWLVPAWMAIGVASLVIAFVPLRRLHRLFGRSRGATAIVPCVDRRAQAQALAIGRAVRLAARFAPFRADCYPTAIVAQLLCRLHRVPAALHLGVARPFVTGEPPLAAHAWVVSGPVTVSGGRGNFIRYTPLGCWTVGL